MEIDQNGYVPSPDEHSERGATEMTLRRHGVPEEQITSFFAPYPAD